MPICVLSSCRFSVFFSPCTLCSYRWSKVVGNGVRFRDAFISVMIGLFINNVLPARIGEIARGYALARRRGISFTYSVTTVFVDRFFDLVGLLIITFIFSSPKMAFLTRQWGIYMLLGLFHCLRDIAYHIKQRRCR